MTAAPRPRTAPCAKRKELAATGELAPDRHHGDEQREAKPEHRLILETTLVPVARVLPYHGRIPDRLVLQASRTRGPNGGCTPFGPRSLGVGALRPVRPVPFGTSGTRGTVATLVPNEGTRGETMERPNTVPALVLIGIGVVLLLAQLTGVGPEAVVAVIGAGFLIAYAATRTYGFLIPGGIMTGLGIGIVIQAQAVASQGEPVLLGLGIGFLAIYAVDAVVRRSEALWWPVIPGGILTTIGVLVGTGRESWLENAGSWWPAILIVIGALILLSQRWTARPRTGMEEGS